MGKVVLSYEQPGDIRSGENKVIRAGGGGGTSDYEALSNKPSINDVELVGNKTSSDLGIIDVDQGIENAGKILTVNNQGMITPEDNNAERVSYDDTNTHIVEGVNVQEALESINSRFDDIGVLKTDSLKVRRIRLTFYAQENATTIAVPSPVVFSTAQPTIQSVDSNFINNMRILDADASPAVSAEDYPNGYTLNVGFESSEYYADFNEFPFFGFMATSNYEQAEVWSPCQNITEYEVGKMAYARAIKIEVSEDGINYLELGTFNSDIDNPTTLVVDSGHTIYMPIYQYCTSAISSETHLEIKNGCKEISYEDYLALSEAEKMNGTAYYINDLDIEGEEHRISTTEQMIDVFVDGKPVYERLIQFDETVDLNVSESSVILENAGFIENLVGAIGMGDNNGSVCSPEIFLDGTNLVAANPFPFAAKYVILRYTKVADEPLPEGVGRSDGGLADPIHVYSPEERFVGKWVDGKNIYEKTIEVTGYTSFSRIAYDLTTIPDIDTIVSGHCVILSELENGTDFYKLWSKKDTGLVRGESTGSWEDISKVYLVLQYTKQTT